MITRSLALALALAAPIAATATDVTFTYQGRLEVAGKPYEGDATFRFALIDTAANPERVLWLNDTDTTTTLPPASGVALTVRKGVFTVDLGDTSIPNMSELSPTVFNESDSLALRVWVDDGVNGLEQLAPDRPVVQAGDLGRESNKSITIYVSPAGDDRNPGTNPLAPKATVQAAVNVLPPILKHAATVQLEKGTYQQETLISRLHAFAQEGVLTIRGDTSTPNNVTFDGTGLGDSAICFAARNTHSPIVVEGVRVQDYLGAGVSLGTAQGVNVRNSEFTSNTVGLSARILSSFNVQNCIFTSNGIGVDIASACTGTVSSVTISNSTTAGGIEVGGASSVTVLAATIQGNSGAGVRAYNGGHINIRNTSSISGNGTAGYYFNLESEYNSYLNIGGGVTISGGPNGGVRANRGGYVLLSGANTISNNPIGVQALYGGLAEFNQASGATLNFSGNTQNTHTANDGRYYIVN